jgi:signal transduction histidine kinase
METEIFDKVRIPIVIWKLGDATTTPSDASPDVKRPTSERLGATQISSLKCYYTNGLISGLTKEMTLSEYLAKGINYSQLYADLSRPNTNVITQAKDIYLDHFDGSLFLEVHYPHASNMHILTTINKKLRKPLTNIIGLLSIVSERNMDAEQKKYMSIFRQSSYGIISVANDIIDLVNFDGGHVRLEPELTELKVLLTACLGTHVAECSSKGIHAKFAIDSAVPSYIYVDPSRLKQILGNLIKNAVQYTNTGSVVVTVRLINKEDPLSTSFDSTTDVSGKSSTLAALTKPKLLENYSFLFTVKDSGSGMDDEKKKNVEIILQSSDHQYLHTNGFGLILATQICRLMGGTIWFKSEPDIGTVFYFKILAGGRPTAPDRETSCRADAILRIPPTNPNKPQQTKE